MGDESSHMRVPAKPVNLCFGALEQSAMTPLPLAPSPCSSSALTPGAGVLHLRELQVLCCVCVVERDREVVGKFACH